MIWHTPAYCQFPAVLAVLSMCMHVADGNTTTRSSSGRIHAVGSRARLLLRKCCKLGGNLSDTLQ